MLLFSRSLALTALCSLAVSSIALASDASSRPIVVALATATPQSTSVPTVAPTAVGTSSPVATTTPNGSGSGAGGAGIAGNHVPLSTPDPVASRPGIFAPTASPFTLQAAVTLEPVRSLLACPLTLTFEGQITAAHWPEGARTVTFRWVRSDGVATSPQTLTFAGLSLVSQTQTVPFTWVVGKSTIGDLELDILKPLAVQSNRVAFTLHCGPPGPTTLAVPTPAPFPFPLPR